MSPRAGGLLVCFPMRWSRAEEASAFAVAPANSTRPAVVPAPWLTPHDSDRSSQTVTR